MDDICNYVKNAGVDIGLAFDGDADRLIVIDENGEVVDGDKIMLICAENLKSMNMLRKDTLVITVMSNLGLVLKAKDLGINTIQTAVGDRYVLEEMLKSGYNLGGESSGHIIFLNHNTTGDGLISALNILKILKTSDKKMSELAKIYETMPQCIVNAKVSNSKKKDYDKDEVILDEIQHLENEFAGKGRVLVRASGTEPCVRVMIEGENQDVIMQKANYLASIIEARLG